MYRQGLGDCFLLSFPRAQAGSQFHVLIDCGLISVATKPRTIMTKVARDIQAATGGRLDLVVVTHQHWDHVSGFSPEQAQEIFAGMEVGTVWYAWTEDPSNALGQKLRAEREAKARAVHQAAIALRDANDSRHAMLVGSAERLGALLSFFGIHDPPYTPLASPSEGTTGKVQRAFEFMGQRPGATVRFCHPTDPPQNLPDVPGLRVYVLGPPEDEGLIKRSDPTVKGREVYDFAADRAIAEHLLAAFTRQSGGKESSDSARDLPFDAYLRRTPDQTQALKALLANTWNQPGEDWRRIESDWMAAAESLALALDQHTNNTSLALAFELTESGGVLLFVGDAQVGNWLSWQDLSWTVKERGEDKAVTGPDLLARTVLYKVGHHGSHNATLREKGLELMNRPDLVALVPVNVAQAKANHWFEMPFDKLVKRLKEKTRGRVIFSDSATPFPGDADLADLSAKARKAFKSTVKPGPDALYYDYYLPM